MIDCVIVGEAWGRQEAAYGEAFVGDAGQELYRMLGDAGFHNNILPRHFVSPLRMSKLWEAFPYPRLNVFNCRPPDPEAKNRVEFFYAKPSDKKDIDRSLPRRRFGASNAYVLKRFGADVRLLHEHLRSLQPFLIIALGATALWALGITGGIKSLRGSVIQSDYGKVLPIIHPAAILRDWSQRTIAVLDFVKARRELQYPEIRVTPREIWTEPTINDLYTWWDEHGSKSSLLAIDIETVREVQQVGEINIASDSTHALHVPFVYRDSDKPKHLTRWWKTDADELAAWQFVKMVCESPIPKINQNIVQFDVYWMLKELGIGILNIVDDTMQKMHCVQPEWDKNLGFLGSIFCNERQWKYIRRETGKSDD